MGSFEANYDKETLRGFTAEERTRLQKLHEQLDASFDAIASFLAQEHGYGEADPRGREEAREAIERWESEAEMDLDRPYLDRPVIKPVGTLQRLLSEHHEISENILEFRDEPIDRDEAIGDT
jgi:hypothetical protein